ncbi:hydrolase [Halorientalis salina]|uniref:hydrolase n=1 Tax=Halorientalis salina TaxID=2932266 RepID=UPI0010AC1A11|nr:hydrolase [Halorientalis salina]
MQGQWTGASVESDDGKPDPEMWTPVDVPGRPTVFQDADAVAYRTEFEDPRSEGSGRAVLELRGLYAHARIWLNDDLVGTHDAYFRPFRHSFEPAETNELVVECRRPQDRFGGIHDTDAVPSEEAIPGIWWDVSLETYPETFISNLDVRPRVDGDDAAIDVRAVVEAGEPLDDRLTFSLRPEGDFQSRGMMDRAQVQAAAGERTVVTHTIEVHDPSLWWPRGHGPQHQYSVRAKLGDFTTSVTTGLCEIDRDEDGLLVNGEPVSGRGFTVQAATPADIKLAADANATIVRLHAHAPPQAVYEAADEAGLLVWQDLPLTGPGEFSVSRGEDVVNNLIWTYDNHPSLAAFGVHDDPVDLFPDVLGSGYMDRLRMRWRTWRADYDHGPAESLAERLPDDRPVFPVVGPVGIDPDAAAVYPGWDYGTADSTEWVLDHYDVGDVVAEFGAGAVGLGDVTDPSGFDEAKHAAHVADEDDPHASQRYQAKVVSQVAETLRLRDSDLFTAFALRDTGDAGMGVLERNGTEKDAYQSLTDSFEPVQAFLSDPTPGATTELTVINDTPEEVEGIVKWVAGDMEGDTEMAIPAFDRDTLGTLTIPDDADGLSLMVALYEENDEGEMVETRAVGNDYLI